MDVQSILLLTYEIYKIADELKGNKRRCARLIERLRALETPINRLKEKPCQTATETLAQTLIVIKDAHTLVLKFKNENRLARACGAMTGRTKADFAGINERLQSCIQGLDLAISVQMLSDPSKAAETHSEANDAAAERSHRTDSQSRESALPLHHRHAREIAKGLSDEAKPPNEHLADSLSNLARLLKSEGEDDETKPFRTKIEKMTLATNNHCSLAAHLKDIALLLNDQEGKNNEANCPYKSALQLFEQLHGPNRKVVATALDNLAEFLRAQRGNCDENCCIKIVKVVLGPSPPDLAVWFEDLALFLQDHKINREARALYELSLKIRENERTHSHVPRLLFSLAELLEIEGEYNTAKTYYENSLKIREEVNGAHHPHVAEALNKLADFLKARGKYNEAKQYYERSFEILNVEYGEKHDKVVTTLNNIADLLKKQGEDDEAIKFYIDTLKSRDSHQVQQSSSIVDC